MAEAEYHQMTLGALCNRRQRRADKALEFGGGACLACSRKYREGFVIAK